MSGETDWVVKHIKSGLSKSLPARSASEAARWFGTETKITGTVEVSGDASNSIELYEVIAVYSSRKIVY